FVEFLAAPRADDDVGRTTDDGFRRHDPLLGGLAAGKFGEDVDAASDCDQLRDPSDAGNHGFVPFLEIDLGTPAAPCAASYFRDWQQVALPVLQHAAPPDRSGANVRTTSLSWARSRHVTTVP